VTTSTSSRHASSSLSSTAGDDLSCIPSSAPRDVAGPGRARSFVAFASPRSGPCSLEVANQPIAIGSVGMRWRDSLRGVTCADGPDGTGRHELVAIAKVRVAGSNPVVRSKSPQVSGLLAGRGCTAIRRGHARVAGSTSWRAEERARGRRGCAAGSGGR
jgi:hypothetical protein